MQKVRYKNKTYSSYASLCRALKISQSSLYQRKKAGQSLSKAIENCKEAKAIRNTKVVYNGKTYNGYKELAFSIGYLYPGKLRERAKEIGLTKAVKYCQEIVQHGRHTKKGRIKYNGKAYLNVQQLCDEYHIKYYNFVRFNNRFKNITQAIQKSQEVERKIKLNDKIYRTYIQLLDDYGIDNYGYFMEMLKKEKDIEIALEGAMIHDIHKRQSRT